jgi:hypothetical protein
VRILVTERVTPTLVKPSPNSLLNRINQKKGVSGALSRVWLNRWSWRIPSSRVRILRVGRFRVTPLESLFDLFLHVGDGRKHSHCVFERGRIRGNFPLPGLADRSRTLCIKIIRLLSGIFFAHLTFPDQRRGFFGHLLRRFE